VDRQLPSTFRHLDRSDFSHWEDRSVVPRSRL
jgi:hypothetical protein